MWNGRQCWGVKKMETFVKMDVKHGNGYQKSKMWISFFVEHGKMKDILL